jgi:hypothetical protein
MVTPVAVYLVSEDCELSHEIISCGGGRFARIFLGLAPGWTAAKGAPVAAEQVQEHIEQIRDPQNYTIPNSITDELKIIMTALQQ